LGPFKTIPLDFCGPTKHVEMTQKLLQPMLNQSIQEFRKFYKRLNDDVRRPFDPQVALCQAKNGKLLTNKNQVLAGWKDHFKEQRREQRLRDGATNTSIRFEV
jgi:hypothetical protein